MSNLTLSNLLAYGVASAKNNFTHFFQGFGVIIITQIALHATRIIQTDISKVTHLSSKRISDIRRLLSQISTTLTVAYFFKNKNESFSHTLKNNSWGFALCAFEALQHAEPINSFLKNKINNLTIPNFLERTGHVLFDISAKFNYLFSINCLADSYNSALVPAFVEEVIFRGVLQEGLLRQLPRLVLHSIVKISPESMNLPIIKIMRIVVSSVLFGMAHLKVERTQRTISESAQLHTQHQIFSICLAGARYAYLNENLGVFAGILSHFTDDFYFILAQHFGQMSCERDSRR